MYFWYVVMRKFPLDLKEVTFDQAVEICKSLCGKLYELEKFCVKMFIICIKNGSHFSRLSI